MTTIAAFRKEYELRFYGDPPTRRKVIGTLTRGAKEIEISITEEAEPFVRIMNRIGDSSSRARQFFIIFPASQLSETIALLNEAQATLEK